MLSLVVPLTTISAGKIKYDVKQRNAGVGDDVIISSDTAPHHGCDMALPGVVPCEDMKSH